MAKYTSTPADQLLRAEVADTILLALCDDQSFGEPKCFSAWCRDHKQLLVSLFSGQGIGNLQRAVAFLRREALKLRRDPPEILCLLLDSMDDGSMPDDLAEALRHVGLTDRTALIRGAMLNATFAQSLFEIAPEGGLNEILKTYFT
jgi:hypothetical protein